MEEVSAFESANGRNDYEQLVERLLSDPRFGERWGRHWLDLARYADSSGYEADRPRKIWHYRDWVIDALNQDHPVSNLSSSSLVGIYYHKQQTKVEWPQDFIAMPCLIQVFVMRQYWIE